MPRNLIGILQKFDFFSKIKLFILEVYIQERIFKINYGKENTYSRR